MKKKHIGLLLLLPLAMLLVFSISVPLTISPILPIQPTDEAEERMQPGKITMKEILPLGEKRVSQNAKIEETGTFTENGTLWVEYQMEISPLPQTMPDLETLIVTEWQEGRAADGINYYETGNNLFWARVTGTRVSVEYEAIQAAWNPDVFADNHGLSLKSGPEVVDDFLNENYQGNTIKWVYEGTFGGILTIGEKTVTITRYLRQIEGKLLEYYVLDKDPQSEIRVISNYEFEEGFDWMGDVFAYDANGRILRMEGDRNDKSINKYEFSQDWVEYPVTIDPTLTVDSSYSDGYLANWGTDYGTVQGQTTAQYLADSTDRAWIENSHTSALEYPYWVERAFLYFNTDSLEDTAIVTWMQIKLYVSVAEADSLYTSALQVQSGMPTYPTDPLELTDYSFVLYSGSYLSSQWIEYMTTGQYNTFALGSSAYSEVNRDGWTKFALRLTNDVSATEPGTNEDYGMAFYTAEKGTGYQPQLWITYQVPVSYPSVSTGTAYDIGSTHATLQGQLTDDGGADCTARFKYGETTDYGRMTAELSEKRTGFSWSQDILDLTAGTVYNFTARASNSAGESTDDNATFLTLPEDPTNIANTPGDQENALTWTKGVGSNRTMIMRSTTGFPTTVTSGTQVYFEDGSSYTDTSLTNGLTYFYSAFAEIDGGGLQQFSSGYDAMAGTPVVVGGSSVTTLDETSIGSTSAQLNGRLDSLGGAGSSDCYFEYYKDGDPAWGDSTLANKDTLTEVGDFDHPITGLDSASLYHFRAISDNGDAADPIYGASNDFTTGQPSAPTMETLGASTGRDWVIMKGKVSSSGGDDPNVWFEWGETVAFGETTDPSIPLVTGTLYDSEPIYELEPATTYYFVVVGGNAYGTGYGDVLSFTTDTPSAPTVETSSASQIRATSAQLNALLSSDGGQTSQAQFQLSTTGDFAGEETDTGWMDGFTSGKPIDYLAINLTVEQTYYFRAQAKNSGGTTTASTNQSFTTVFGAPEDFITTPLSDTSIALVWSRVGDKTEIWGKAGSFPADRLDGEQVYSGAEESTTWSGRLPGTTYFFRAWSWREGDVYSGTYVEDVSTTLSGILPGDVETPESKLDFDTPGTPDWFFQTPSSDRIQNFPAVGLIDDVGSQIGLSNSGIWIIFSAIFVMIVGGGSAIASKSALLTAAVVLVAMAILALVGLMPGMIVIAYMLVMLPAAFLMKGAT